MSEIIKQKSCDAYTSNVGLGKGGGGLYVRSKSDTAQGCENAFN